MFAHSLTKGKLIAGCTNRLSVWSCCSLRSCSTLTRCGASIKGTCCSSSSLVSICSEYSSIPYLPLTSASSYIRDWIRRFESPVWSRRGARHSSLLHLLRICYREQDYPHMISYNNKARAAPATTLCRLHSLLPPFFILGVHTAMGVTPSDWNSFS